MSRCCAIRRVHGRGFTLVELLVVLAIIGILVALLFPAVQSAREAGRRIVCANHLKQFVLAVANYTAVHDDQLPPTAVTFFRSSGRRPLPKGNWPCDVFDLEQSHGWRVAVLPFLEEQNLYDQFDFSKGVVTDANFQAISHVLPVFQCPSTPGYPRSIFQGGAVVRRGRDDLSVGAWDYGIPSSPHPDVVAAWVGIKYGMYQKFLARDPRGDCYLEKVYGPAKLVWVTDGLSKTSAALEVAYSPNAYSRKGLDGQWTSAGEPMTGTIWLLAHGTGWAQVPSFLNGFTRPINEQSSRDSRFAFHPGGVNEAFLDGSVRFLSESTSMDALKAMVSRANGDSIPGARE